MIRLFSFLLLVPISSLATAQSIFDRMIQDDPHGRMSATLALPMDSIHGRSNAEVDAALVFTDNQGVRQHWMIEVSARGKFRRNRCAMPPLKLDFSKKELRLAGLSEHDKYKLVLPCFENELGEELILKEHLAYQAYNLVSPLSYRTQLIDLELQDVNGGESHNVVAFLIEDTDQMAARNDAEEIDNVIGRPSDAYLAEAEATHALFQYLVGNGDWSMLMGRNVKMLESGQGLLIPVGYDFDFTGWVGAPYASAVSDVGQRSIYERVYLGYAQPDEVINRVFAKFKEQRRAIIRLINGSALTPESKLVTTRFAARFFSSINRMNGASDLTVYDQLRGETAEIIPSGEFPDSFKGVGR